MGDGVIAMDINGIITQANRAALQILKQSFEDLVDLPFYEKIPLFAIKQNTPLPDVITQVIHRSNTLVFNDNILVHDKNGNSIPISCTITPIMNENKTIYGAVMVFRDISAENERRHHFRIYCKHGSTNPVGRGRICDLYASH